MSITPALIAARIREARRLGWEPGAGAGVFAVLSGADPVRRASA